MSAVSILDPEGRLTMAAAARLLGVHVSSLWRWRQHGVKGHRLRCVKLGPGKTVVLRSDLEEFLAAISDPLTPKDVNDDLASRAAAADAQARAMGL